MKKSNIFIIITVILLIIITIVNLFIKIEVQFFEKKIKAFKESEELLIMLKFEATRELKNIIAITKDSNVKVYIQKILEILE